MVRRPCRVRERMIAVASGRLKSVRSAQPREAQSKPLIEGSPRMLPYADGRAHCHRAYLVYIASICEAYFSAIGLRFSFIVGVSSSPPGSQSSLRTVNFLIASTFET